VAQETRDKVPDSCKMVGSKLTCGSKRFGQLLIEAGVIDAVGLERALERQRTTGERLGEALINMKLVSGSDIVTALATQLEIAVFDPSQIAAIESEVILSVPEHMARHHHVLAVGRDGSTLTLAMADPLDLVAIDDVRVATGCELRVEVGTRAELDDAIATTYRNATATQHLEEVIAGAKLELQSPEDMNLAVASEQELRSKAQDAPIVRLVNLILTQAIVERATDIHIEPHEDHTVVRYRVDGILYDSSTPPKHFHEAIVVRIKILSDMDVAERRVPLDGRFTAAFENRAVDVRVSTLPTIYGEKVAMRLLDKTGFQVRLGDLGFEEEMLEVFQRCILRPYGMVLVSGPTGSGKSTTLYAGMAEIDRIGKNITTVEDPVEYHLERINQVSVNRKAGLTFALGLRSLLRQDPDVMMVGEIRDMETAELAVRSALTGHLVLSTLHANDAPSTATRLVDIGIEPYLVTSAVHLVMAQRLLRKICPECAEPYEPDQRAIRALGEDLLEGTTYLRGLGCKRCRGRGYLGRTAVFEILELTPDLGELIVARASADKLRQKAIESGFVTLRENAARKVRAGITTVEEALTVSTELF
jgi:type IV pilus assembly protein PilB